jgi:acetyl esterase
MERPPSRRHPWALLIALAALAPALALPAERPDRPPPPSIASQAAVPQVLSYRRVGAVSLEAHVFLPKPPGDDRAAVLLFHGGAWRLGEPAWLFDRARGFAEAGLVAISVEYRLSNDGLSPIDAVEDACAAFAWARERATVFGIDPKRVAGYGVSAGGHLVAAAATLPSLRGRPVGSLERPNALVLFSPALDMARNEYFTELMAGKGEPALYSPAEFVDSRLPPTLILQGEEDTIVLARDARAFCATAEKAGARCEVQVYPGVGHLLTRNLKVQYRDFDTDPAFGKDARRREDAFLVSLGYLPRPPNR